MTAPILLFNDECGVCRRIAGWVTRSSRRELGAARIVVRPIGDDPEMLRSLNPELDIWDAYKTIHLVMPDSSMKRGGAAVAEVLRRLPNTRWFAWLFAVGVLGFYPFQLILDLGYATLAAVRPLFGCESCGTPPIWLQPFIWTKHLAKRVFGRPPHVVLHPHATRRAGRVSVVSIRSTP